MALRIVGAATYLTNSDCLSTGRLAEIANGHVPNRSICRELEYDGSKTANDSLAAAHGVDFGLGQLDRQRNLRVWRHELYLSP